MENFSAKLGGNIVISCRKTSYDAVTSQCHDSVTTAEYGWPRRMFRKHIWGPLRNLAINDYRRKHLAISLAFPKGIQMHSTYRASLRFLFCGWSKNAAKEHTAEFLRTYKAITVSRGVLWPIKINKLKAVLKKTGTKRRAHQDERQTINSLAIRSSYTYLSGHEKPWASPKNSTLFVSMLEIEATPSGLWYRARQTSGSKCKAFVSKLIT